MLHAGRQHSQSGITYGGQNIPSQTPFLAWKKKGICCLGSHGSSSLAGLGSVRSGHPTRAPGRNLGKNKEQNLVQLCRKPPGMAVPPQHRVVPRTEVPQSSAEAWFPLGSNAGVGGAEKLPSLVSEIQHIYSEFLLKEPPRFCLLGP